MPLSIVSILHYPSGPPVCCLRYTSSESRFAMGSNRNRVLTYALLVLGAAVPVVLAVEAAHQPACDRGCLVEFTSSYLDAMLAHNPSALKVASGLKSTVNGKPVSLGEGLWKTAKSIPSRQAFADPSTGEAGFFGVVLEEDGKRSQLALRLKINRQQIQEVASVVSPDGAVR
jgi:hypothetical protein